MFEQKERQGLIVFVKNRQVVRKIRHYGNLLYYSKHNHYVVLYVNQDSIDKTMNKLNELRDVTSVEKSLWPTINTEVSSLEDTGIITDEHRGLEQ